MGSTPNQSYTLSFLALGLFLLVAFLYVFGLGQTGLFDVREAQTVTISMGAPTLQDAFIAPPSNTAPHTNPAPFIHGLQYMAMSFFGETTFAMRLPSALAAFLMVFVFYNSVMVLTQARRYALIAAATLALSPSVVLAARLATPDALFALVTMSAAFMFIGNIYQRERSYMRLFVVGLLLGGGFLVGGVWAFILPFFVAFLVALLKSHRVYNVASIAPFSVLVAGYIALMPWMAAVLTQKKPEELLDLLYSLSRLAQFDVALGGSQPWWFFPVLVLLLTVPWSFFLLPGVVANLKTLLQKLDHPEPREALPALALVWLILGGGALIVADYVTGISWQQYFLMGGLWLSAPTALLVADYLDRLPQKSMGALWFAFIFVLSLSVAAVLLWLPQLPDVFSGHETYAGLSPLLENIGLSMPAFSDFWQGVLAVKTDWGLAPVVLSGLFMVSLVMGSYMMRHGALEGVLFTFVGMWFVMFLAIQGLAVPVYDHLQQPLKWMSVKIKGEHQDTPAKVTLYGMHRPSVAYLSGVSPRQVHWAGNAFQSTTLPLFVLTNANHMPDIAPHVPAGASKECFGGYCLIEVYR